MKRYVCFAAALTSLAAQPLFAGTNTTVILGGVTITPSLTEGQPALVTGSVGDLARSPSERFLNQLSLDFLGRSIDPGELDTHGTSLARGVARQQIAATLAGSIEYRTALVRSAYSTHLNRVPNLNELTAGLNLLSSGGTGDQLTASVTGSDEYFTARGQGNVTTFLGALFQDLLGRAADLNALTAYSQQLAAGATRAQVAATVLATQEYRQRVIYGVYNRLLHRVADANGVNQWLAALAQGTSIESMMATLAGSDEYWALVPPTTYRLRAEWGDGSVETIVLQPPVPQDIFFPFQITHRFLDNRPKGGTPEPVNARFTLLADTGVGTAIAQFFVKNVGPQLRNVSVSSPIGASTHATLSGDIIDPGGRDVFSLVVDWGDGRGSQTVTLPAGTTTFKLTHPYPNIGSFQVGLAVKDDDGALATETTSLTVLPLSSPDAIPSVPDLVAADDSGIAPNDDITTATKPSFTGTAKPGHVVNLYANGKLVGFNTASGAGQWSVNLSAPLGEGTYQITARATDAGGTQYLPSQPLLLVVDNTTPYPPSTPDLDASSDTGASNSDDITSASVRKIIGTAEPGGLVELLVDNNLIGIANVAADGTWIVEESRLAPGNHVLVARMKDRAGNQSSTSAGLLLIISNKLTAPSTPDLAPESDTGFSNADRLTSQTRPAFTGSAEPGIGVQLLANGAVVGTSNAEATGRWRISPANALGDGLISFTARAVDSAGNTSPVSGAIVVRIDNLAPAAPSLPDLLQASDNGISNTDNLTSLTTLSFTGTAEAGSWVELFADGTLAGSASAGNDGRWTIGTTRPLSEGVHQITARATDAAGNVSPLSTALTVTVKTTIPVLSIVRVQNSLLLSWPKDAEGFQLENCDSAGNSSWQPVSAPATEAGDAKIVVVPATSSGPRFYRLHKR